MNFHWLEITGLYACMGYVASEVIRIGCTYHSLAVMTVGGLMALYALVCGFWSTGIYIDTLWKRRGNDQRHATDFE